MAGKHRAKTERRQTEAYVWLGTGAITLGLGLALAGGSGVAQADTASSTVNGPRVSPSPGNSAATTTIRTTLSAQSVQTSTNSSAPVDAGAETATSIVSTSESVVRQLSPADTGDNDATGDSSLTSQLLGLESDIPGLDVGPSIPSIPFFELGGGGGGLASKILGALSGGLF
jgi:hypothetical protein